MKDKETLLIEDYINGRLSKKEELEFERRLENDKEFESNYLLHKRLTNLWKDTIDFKNTRYAISETLKKENRSFIKRNLYSIISVAATILVLISTYFIMQYTSDSKSENSKYLSELDSTRKQDAKITFSIDDQRVLTTIDSVKNSLQLISPESGDTIISGNSISFKWKSVEVYTDTLYVYNSKYHKLEYKLIVNVSDSIHIIKYPQLEPGNYVWFISNSKQSKEFIITENK